MAGLIGMGQNKRNSALSGFAKAADLEANRNQTNQTLKANMNAAEQSQKSTMAGAGAAVGLAYAGTAATGMALAGPVGWGIAGGLLLASLF